MWIVAGVLLGSVLLSSLLGFHTGPHSHAVAGAIGLVAALWLVVMALEGRSSSVLWALLSADVVVSGGVGVIAWKGLSTRQLRSASAAASSLTGKEGVAITALGPEGVVRVRGENWSATSLNGNFAIGSPVQVLAVSGIRLEVWGEQSFEHQIENPPRIGVDQVENPVTGDATETRRTSS